MHTRSWLLWLGTALLFISLTTNPLYLLLVLLCATLVFVACRDTSNQSGLARSYYLFFIAGLLVLAGHLVFSVITVGGGRGSTVLLRLPELVLPPLLGGLLLGGPITAEDLAWGALSGLRIWALLVVFGTFNALISHYRLLRLTPRSLFHAGLAVTIGVSFVPQTVRAISEIHAAQRVRGHRFRGLRSYIPLLAPLLAGSLERSIQLAEALDARGFGRTHGTLPRQLPVLMIAGTLLLGAGLFGWLYYGSLVITSVGLGLATLAALMSGGGLLWLAFRRLGQQVQRSTYRRERWHRRDTLVCLVLLLSSAAWLALWIMGSGGLLYTPYPRIAMPAFDLLAGLMLLCLAAPAVAGSPQAGRVRRPPQRLLQRQPRQALPQPTPEAEPQSRMH